MAERGTGRNGPKYQEIAGDLRREINGGKLAVGTQLPTKAALMKQYGVALNTVDRAIDVLRTQGLVQTFQGVGTFVQAPQEQPGFDAGDAKRISDLERRLARLEALVMDICANMGMAYDAEHGDSRTAEVG